VKKHTKHGQYDSLILFSSYYRKADERWKSHLAIMIRCACLSISIFSRHPRSAAEHMSLNVYLVAQGKNIDRETIMIYHPGKISYPMLQHMD
jgi:hypothetical protein